MRYVNVVFGLPVEGPFDYLIPNHLEGKVKVGSRVRVIFGFKKKIGYVVKLSNTTKIKILKPVLEALDSEPILDGNCLKLTKWVSEYYSCSWGEAIETALPDSLRKGRSIDGKA